MAPSTGNPASEPVVRDPGQVATVGVSAITGLMVQFFESD